MKGLGLAGAGLGAAAATAPVFHDLDEVSSSNQAQWKRPWYVKENDFGQITSGVDWAIKKPWSEVNTLRGSRDYMKTLTSPNTDEQAEWSARGSAKKAEWLKSGRPGYALRDVALSGSAAAASRSNSWHLVTDYRGRNINPPETKWTGTPEEASKMLRAAGRLFGCLSVGFMELDSNTMKLMYSYEPGGKEKLTWAGNEPVETSSEHRHPVSAKYVISITDQESQELWKRNPATLMTQIRYERAANIQQRFQTFLRKLGYVCLSEGGNGTGMSPAIGVMCGQGELGRVNRLITPEYGPTVGVFRYVTDLPVAPTKPIDAGIWEFCKSCEKCAEACGGEAIPTGPPTWDATENATPYNAAGWGGHDPAKVPGANPPTPGGWHSPGHEMYPEDARKCRAWRVLPDACRSGRCMSSCTFTKYRGAGIHDIISGVVANTSVFNSFFRVMDDAFGYGLRGRRHDDFTVGSVAGEDDAMNGYWDLKLPIYGIDSTIGADAIS